MHDYNSVRSSKDNRVCYNSDTVRYIVGDSERVAVSWTGETSSVGTLE